MIPELFTRSGVYTSLMETATDLIERAAFLPDPGKHLLHDASFIKDDVKAGFPASFLLVDVAIPVRSVAQDANTALLGRMAFAASAPFEEFCPFLFSNHVQQSRLALAVTTDLPLSVPAVD